MPHTRTHYLMPSARKLRRQKLVGKELDLLILAGCSCLLTVLYHPVAEALSPSQSIGGGSQSAIAAQVKSSANQTAPIHTTLPPEREKIKQEEE